MKRSLRGWLLRRCRCLAALPLLTVVVACHDRGHDRDHGRDGEYARVPPGACDLPVPSWLVLGPFRLDTGALRLDRSDVGDPALVSPVAGDAVVGYSVVGDVAGSPERRWRRVSSDSLGRVDLYSVFPEASLDDRAAYAISYVTSPDARTVRMAVESDDAVVVWINGHRVLRNDAARELRSRADTITIPLSAGVNRLLYRVVNRGGGFGLGARFLNASPDPTGDLLIDASKRDAELFARRAPASVVSPGASRRASHPASQRASRVALGPAMMDPRARLENSDGDTSSVLLAPVRVCVTRRAPDVGGISLVAGSDTERVPRSAVGEPVMVTLRAR